MQSPFSIEDNENLDLIQARAPQAVNTFQVTPRAIGLDASPCYDCIPALLEQLEGPEHR